MKNIPRLDGIRSVAIIMVIVYHYFACIFDKIYFNVLWKYPIHALSQMFIGVDLFFILSGYLVGSILFKNKNSNNLIPKFYIKRVLRIIPAYYLILLSYYLLSQLNLLKSFPWLCHQNVPLHAYLYFSQNFHNAINKNLGANYLSVTWSLAIEEQFYVILPIMVKYFSVRNLKVTLWISVFFAIILRHYIGGIPGYVLLFTRMDALFIGVLIAIYNSENTFKNLICKYKKHLQITLIVSIFLFFGYTIHHKMGGDLHTISLVILTIIFVLILTNSIPIYFSRFLESKFCSHVSKITFMLYLLHQIILGIIFQLVNNSEPKLSNLNEFLIMLLSLFLTIVFSIFTYFLFENRINLVGKKIKY